MNESFSALLTDDDVIHANRLHWRTAWRGRTGVRYWLIMTAIFTVMILFTTAGDRPWSLALPIAVVGGATAGMLTAALSALIGFLSIPKHSRKMLEQNQMLRHQYDYRILAGRFRYDFPAGSGEMNLDDCYKWAENEWLFLIYLSAGQFYILPKRAMTETQYDHVRGALVQSQCPVAGFGNS